MSWPWNADTVTRIRAVEVEDSHGNLAPDWPNASRVLCRRVMFAPATDGDGGTVYGGPALDLAPGDHLEHHGRRYEVVGTPQRWNPGVVAVVESVDIPGQ